MIGSLIGTDARMEGTVQGYCIENARERFDEIDDNENGSISLSGMSPPLEFPIQY
ncbi:hypothetical protein F9C07_9110 [Aspergillus flavus]|uniref:Uncharacterized protein n=1 Tax=Aspergillus flavus (strain ATCC 200026 / FGSC A1120 / IAM 13836 / NRRL 3357 / JCM 12722 / SRRC 167) TaxID=332952 RepID=A0A7U2MJG7_ASPFN|nr:hypothetical protein F9C07_9110 [Aspergillus flavus]